MAFVAVCDDIRLSDCCPVGEKEPGEFEHDAVALLDFLYFLRPDRHVSVLAVGVLEKETGFDDPYRGRIGIGDTHAYGVDAELIDRGLLRRGLAAEVAADNADLAGLEINFGGDGEEAHGDEEKSHTTEDDVNQ